jgi:hypothetical protein
MILEPLIALPTAMTGVWRQFGLHLFEGKLPLSDMDKLERLGEVWAKRNTGKRVELTVIFPSDTRMTSEERARMVRIIKRWEHVRTASATVILATGLIGAGQRGVLTGLLLLAPPPHPAKVFGEVGAAVDWLAPHIASLCGPEATPAALMAAVDEMSARFRAARGSLRPAPLG